MLLTPSTLQDLNQDHRDGLTNAVITLGKRIPLLHIGLTNSAIGRLILGAINFRYFSSFLEMYRSELHEILIRALERSKWTRSTRDEDNFRQVICSHLYSDISPNNTEIPSTRSGSGDIRIFGRKIELKYVNPDKRDKLDIILADIDLLLDLKVEFCIVALRFDSDHNDEHLVRTVDLPLLATSRAVAPIAPHGPHNYYGPGIFLPACYPHDIKRISIANNGRSKKTNSYLSIERAHNIERSSFITIGLNNFHVDVIGAREDGLLIFLYKRADEVEFRRVTAPQDIEVPYQPIPIRLAAIERVSVFSAPQLSGRKKILLEDNVARIFL
ncbi:hypothetical protein [Burkholderia stabilis]|uniref:hypothetical protein n=1 Tax=Burkholderia stabilis TaxID=95485 RepID=UPI001012ED3B|nr:hypothetical protein [Burkholderia stabilis]